MTISMTQAGPIRPLELDENSEREFEAGRLLFGGYEPHCSRILSLIRTGAR